MPGMNAPHATLARPGLLGRLGQSLRILLVAVILALPLPVRAQMLSLQWIQTKLADHADQPMLVSPNGLAWAGGGELYVATRPTLLAPSQVLHFRSVPAGYLPDLFYQSAYAASNFITVKVGGDGAIYVTDAGRREVRRLQPTPGGLQDILVAGGLGMPLGAPLDAVADAHGAVYIADGDHILRADPVLDAGGAVIGYAPSAAPPIAIASPTGLAWQDAATLLVATGPDHRLRSVEVATGIVHDLALGLDDPVAVAQGIDGVYIADRNRHEILRYDPASGATTARAMLLDDLGGVAADGAGNLFYTRTIQQQIWKVLPKATFDATDVRQGSKTLELMFFFNAPGTVDQRVAVIQGEPLGVFRIDGGTLDPGVAYGANIVARVDLSFHPEYPWTQLGALRLVAGGVPVATVPLAGDGVGPQVAFPGMNDPAALDAGAIAPAGVAMDAYGTFYYADPGRHQVVKVERAVDGSLTQMVVAAAAAPTGVAVDGAGDVYFADASAGTLRKATLVNGAYDLSAPPLATGLTVTDLAVDGAGNLFYAPSGLNQVVGRKADGTTVTVLSQADGLNQPAGVATDPAGTVYVADLRPDGSGALWRVIDPFGHRAVHDLALDAPLDSPRGLAVDGRDVVYLAVAGQVVQAEQHLGTWEVTPVFGGLARPQGVAVDGQGNLVVTDPTHPTRPLVRLDVNSAPRLDFGRVLVNPSPAPTLPLAIQNRGNDLLEIPAPTAGLNPSVLAPFLWDPAQNPFAPIPVAGGSKILGRGERVVARIGFAPASQSPFDQPMTLVTNDLNAGPPTFDTRTLTLRGQGVLPAAITLGGLAQTYTGAPLAATATTVPPGLPVTFTYDGQSAPPTSAGRYHVVASVDTAGYQGSAQGDLTIAKAAATVTLGALSQVYTGSPLAVTVTVDPPALAGAVAITYDGAAAAPSAIGLYQVAAVVQDPNWQGRDDNIMHITPPSAPATTTTLAVTGGAYAGQTVTLAATVAGTGRTPAGTVYFLDGADPEAATIVGRVALAPTGAADTAGASLDLATLAPGAHTLWASYGGDGQDADSRSAPVAWTVQAATLRFDPVGAPGQPLALTVAGSQTGTLGIQVSALGTLPAGTLTFAVTGLPASVAATFTPASVDVASLPATIQLRVTGGVRAQVRPGTGWVPPLGGGAAGAFLACGLLALPWARRRRTGLWTGLALLLALGLLGCWSRNPQGTTYQATLVATDANGAVAGSAPLTVMVVPGPPGQ